MVSWVIPSKKVVHAEAETLRCTVCYIGDLHQRAEFVLDEFRARM